MCLTNRRLNRVLTVYVTNKKRPKMSPLSILRLQISAFFFI